MRRNPLIAGRSRWAVLAIAITFLAWLLTAGAAQAVVVNDSGTLAGVAMVPGTSAPSGMVQTASGCFDPALQFTPDLSYEPSVIGLNQLCWRGGGVMHANETYALTWDPYHVYWSGTRGYVEQFLRDVADGSGTFTSPYAVTSQYTDSSTLEAGSSFLVNSRANNLSKYGGGCVDFGSSSGSSCDIGVGTTQGYDYPGSSNMGSCWGGSGGPCLTDSDIRGEVMRIAADTQLMTHSEPGYTPTVVVLTPPAVVDCLDSTGTLCSANGSSTAQFCSYHSQVNGIDYVVQPWTVHTSCDEPGLPTLGSSPTPQQLATDAGSRLVGPLSASQIAAIVNPSMNGWVADNGSEIDDNAPCAPAGPGLDTVQVGSDSYVLQREFNNAAVMEYDPNTYFGCAPNVFLIPSFVVPSAVNAGDVVVFDGSSTASTLIVPNAGYQWSFGDGTGATGPSVEHSYAAGGNYTVKLTVTDRGGNVTTLSQTISVLSSSGLVIPSNPPTSNSSNVGSFGGLQVRMQLMPQGLHSILRNGIEVSVKSNQPADGFAIVTITRSQARRAHISAGWGTYVTIGRGTIWQVKDGTVMLYLHLSRGVAAKLSHLRHVTLSISLQLVGSNGSHLTIDAAGRY